MAVPYVGIQASWDKCSINISREINPHIGVVLQWCIGPIAQHWRQPSPHGEGLHAMAKPSPWRDFYDGDIAPRRHSSPFGDTHRHMATHFPIWRQASQRRDSVENLITFCIQLVWVRMLSKRWQAGEIKKAKVEALPPYRHPRWLKGLGVSG